jgi:hypothetical protein
LLAGTRVVLADATEDDVVLRPPPPGEGIADVGAAVRDALRFPLSGQPLEALATRGGRATIVVEPPMLPIPSASADPRREAVAAAADELVRIGVAPERQTLLVAGGLARRAQQSELEALVRPGFARRFHGRVEVHDAESARLVELPTRDGLGPRVHPALVETDLVVVVTAAETVLHGGPGALLAGACARTLRAAHATSLVETSGASGWKTATELEEAIGARVPLIGVSLALNHPRFSGSLQGYPYEAQALERVASSPLRRLYGALPGPLRSHVLHSLGCEISVAAAFAGPPSVAHAEAMLRAIEARSAPLDRRLDAICIGVPRLTPYLPRERPNPLLASFLALGLALRLWRDDFPLVPDGTAVLVHGFERRFKHPTQHPYRAFFAATRAGPEPEALAEAEREAAVDERALKAYRDGRACHPLLPFADWAACAPALERLGTVLVAGCRDATAARSLGFVPTHGLGAALAMARGRTEGSARVGFLVSPPYFPLRVSR